MPAWVRVVRSLQLCQQPCHFLVGNTAGCEARPHLEQVPAIEATLPCVACAKTTRQSRVCCRLPTIPPSGSRSVTLLAATRSSSISAGS